VNGVALERAGITRETVDPPGGVIVRDDDREPTGLLLDAAGLLVVRAIPEIADDVLSRSLADAHAASLRRGYTSVTGSASLRELELYARLDAEGRLDQRIFAWGPLGAPDAVFTRWLELAASLPRDGRVRLVAFKGFVDGVFASRTAALEEPYADAPDITGELAIDPEWLAELVLRANRAGYPVALHAIGDRAVRVSLDAFERSREVLGHSLVNRVEHADLVRPEDVERFAELGVAASVQPTFILFRSPATSTYVPRLGRERTERAFPFRTLSDAGVMLLFGTDHPVGYLAQAPTLTLVAAVEREYLDGTPFSPDERLDLATAVEAATRGPAIAIGEDDLGVLDPGAIADIVVVRELLPDLAATTEPPILVVAGGRVVAD
jgi:hypothetical protein